MDAGYYSSDSSGIGGGEDSSGNGGVDLTASSDSSGIGGGGSIQDQGTGTGNFNAPGDITGMGFGGVGQGPGGPPGGFGGGYYPGGGGGGGGVGGAGGFLDTGGIGGGGGSIYGLGGAGGFGGLGFGTDLGSLAQNAGFGFGPSAGNPAGWGPSPEFVNTGPDAAPVQSAQQLNDPGFLTPGANDPNAAQPSAPGGTGSGPQQSIMDQILSVLGGINPISTASAAEAPPGSVPPSLGAYNDNPMLNPANQAALDRSMILQNMENTLSPQDLAIPFGGPGAPQSLGGVTSNAPAVNAAPPSGFLGDTGSGIPGMFAGGGLAPGSTGAPLSVGGVASGAPQGDQSTNFAGQFAPAEGMPGAVSPLAAFSGTQFGPTPLSVFANQFAPAEGMPSAVSPLQAFTGTPIGQPPTGLSATEEPAVVTGGQDVPSAPIDSAPPSGFLSGAGSNIPGMFAGGGMVPSGVAGTTAGTETPPAPDSPADFAARYSAAPDQQAVSPLQAFTGTRIGPSPGDPFASQFAPAEPDLAANQQSFGPPAQAGNIPLPQPDPRTNFANQFAPAEPALAANQQSFGPQTQVGNVPTPRTAPGQAGGPPTAPEGGGPPARVPQQAGGGAPAPQQAGGGAGGAGGGAPAGGAGGSPDQQRGGFERGRRRTIGQQIFGSGGMVSSLFGGGQLGDTVGSLMAQLGIPAALIFAATRGGGARLPMVGGARAMSGAGQVGGFSPQFSRQLFPGPGIPALVGLGLGGAALGQSLVNPGQQGQGGAGQGGSQPPDQSPGTARPSPPTLPTATTGPVATTPADLTGGAREGATRARPAPFGPGSAPQGTMAGANYEPGMLMPPVTAIGGGAATQAESFITQRGGHTAGAGAPQLNPEFASRVQRAAQAYEAETGRRAVFDEMGRSHELQRKYRADFLAGRGGRAAPEGQSRHEKGFAIDIPDGDFQNWMHRNAYRFGLTGLAPSLDDPNHFQMASPVLAGIQQRQAANAQ